MDLAPTPPPPTPPPQPPTWTSFHPSCHPSQKHDHHHHHHPHPHHRYHHHHHHHHPHMDISSLISSSPHNPAANPARMHEIWNLDIVTLFASLSHALQFSRTHEIFTRTTNYAGISEESSLDSRWERGVNSKQKSDKNLRNPCTLHRSADFWELSRREALNFCERSSRLTFPEVWAFLRLDKFSGYPICLPTLCGRVVVRMSNGESQTTKTKQTGQLKKRLQWRPFICQSVLIPA